MVALPILLAALGANAGQDVEPPFATLRRHGFEVAGTSDGGAFRDPKSGFGGVWYSAGSSPFGGGSKSDALAILVLRYPAPLDVAALAAKFSAEERRLLRDETQNPPLVATSGAVLFGMARMSADRLDGWKALTDEAERFVRVAGRPIAVPATDAERIFDAAIWHPRRDERKKAPLPPRHRFPERFRAKTIGERDLLTLAEQFEWSTYTGMEGGSGVGGTTLWIGRGDTFHFLLRLGVPEDDSAFLPRTSDRLALTTRFEPRGTGTEDAEVARLAADFPTWNLQREGGQIAVSATIALGKGMTGREIDAAVRRRISEIERISARLGRSERG